MKDRFSDADDIAWHQFAVDRIVAQNSAAPLWRVCSTGMDVYFCNISGVADLLGKALREQKIVRAGIKRDAQKRDWILSLVITDETNPEIKAPLNSNEARGSNLFG